jgi:hypothetical protein
VSTWSDLDYFEVQIPGNGIVQVDFTTEGDLSRSQLYTVRLLDASGAVVDEVIAGTGGREQVESRVLAGTYYIRVQRGSSHSREQYGFTISFAAETGGLELEPNDSRESANVISVGAAVRGRVSTWSDLDYFEVQITGNGIVQVDFTTEGDLSRSQLYTVRLLDASGAVVDEVIAGTGDREQVESRVLAGTYYIRVQRGSSHSREQYEFTTSFAAETGDAEVVGTIEEETGDAEVVGEIG